MPSANGKNVARTRQRAVRTVNNASSQRTHARLSKPASDYARALVNPFSGPLAALPDLPVIQTRKERFWVKGTATTSTSGKGYILFNPFNAAVKDLACAFVSSSTSAESDSFPATISATGCVAKSSNSSYSTTDVDGHNTLGFRIVSAGCRLMYTGQAVKRSGNYVALHEPSHDGLVGKTTDNLLALPEGKKVGIQEHKGWFGCTYLPVDLGDTKYINHYKSLGGTPETFAWKADDTQVNLPQYPFMGVILSSQAGESVTFEYECFATFEFIGKAAPGKTPSYADPVGLAAVHTAAASHPHTMIHHGESAEQHAVQGALTQLTHMVSTVGQGLNALSGVTQDVKQITNAIRQPSSSSTASSIFDTIGTIWKGVSTVAPILASIL